MKKLIVALALVALLPLAGCSPRMFGALLATAAIVGTVAVLTAHDAHMHDEYCGHHRQWHSGRWVYHYGGHWEYYEHGSNQWHYYSE